MELEVFLRAAATLTGQEPLLRPLAQLSSPPDEGALAELSQTRSGILSASADTVYACRALGPRAVYLSAEASDEALAAAHGHCRYLAEDEAQIRRLDALVHPLLQEGYLEDIAIRVWPSGGPDGTFTAQNIPRFARLIRRSEHLAVRGVFLPFDLQGDLSRQAKDAFSLVKQLRSELPCLFHAFCFEGLLPALTQGDESLWQTLHMLASLNDTSLYADFFIS